jgi:hypothetical protein
MSWLQKIGIAFGMLLAIIGSYLLYQTDADTTMGVALTINTNLENGLVGHWTFDGEDIDLSSDTAEVIDRSGSGNNGNWLNHASTTFAGVVGQAIEFDNDDDYIDFGDIHDLTSILTIAARFKPTAETVADSGSNDIIKKELAYTFSIVDGTVQYDVRGTEWSYKDSGYVPPANEWTHGLLTYDGSVIRMYINGQEYASTSEAGVIPGNAFSFCVANECNVNPFYFGGAIDDVRVYNRTLSAE